MLALGRLARLTGALGANGFFGEERPAIYEKLMALRASRDPLTRISLWLRRLISGTSRAGTTPIGRRTSGPS